MFALAALLGAVGIEPHPPVALPRVEATIQVDGLLDEPVWAEAAVLRAFRQYLPVDDRPPDDSTVVLVWYSPTAIHFAVRAFERHGGVQATLADRDKITSDDHVLILLDTFDDRRQAFLFGTNPLGVQADGILRDGARSTSSFSSQTGGGAYAIDLSPDFVYQSRGRVRANGYDVEIRIPFKSLRFQAGERQDWGINIIRRVQHSGYEDTWNPVRHDDASFLAQNGRLVGLTGLSRGLVLDLNPELTASLPGAPGDGGWDYDAQRPEIGGNVRWGVTNNLILNGTVNPDFSQVEADVAQIQFDPRQALFFPEKRPFFLDGLEQFTTPNTLIYTRRLANPDAAVKLTGKVGTTNVALLSAVDAATASPAGSHPVSTWLRVRRDVLGESAVGIAYTDRIEGDAFNRVAAADGRLVLGAYTVQLQGGGSLTRNDGVTRAAPLWMATAARSGRGFGFSSSLRGFHPDFRAGSGFVSRVGIVHANFTPRYTLLGAEGATLESWTGSLTFDGTWDYDRFFDIETPNDSKFHVTGQFSFRGGWRLAAAVLIESFKYPPSLYADYFIERTLGSGAVDTVPYVGTDRLSNVDVVLNLSTPQFKTFSGSLFFVAGRDENFFEWAGADIYLGTLDLEWRPTEKLRANLLYNHTQYVRPTDGSTVNRRHIPRLKVEYQLSRAVFVRVVGQYDAETTDDLRDASRTEAPILIRAADGSFARAVGGSRNDLQVDWLFSFRPNPGTVFFAGYGASLVEPDAFRFRGLTRVRDGFFVKLSYLWRV